MESNTTMIKRLFNKTVMAMFFGITTMSFLAACGGDDEGGNAAGNNVNANDTQKSPHALRLEMPRVQPGNNYQLIVKYDDEIGVNYIIEWDKTKRAQRWTCWQWTKENIKTGWDRKKWNGATWNGRTWNGDPFHEETQIEMQYRTRLSDYNYSKYGYQRGHICASADRICSMNVNGQTFSLANIQPQIAGFNTGVWQKMEDKVRIWSKTTTNNNGVLYICKGGTIGDVNLNGKNVQGVINDSKNPIIVPKYFFMAVLRQTKDNIFSAMAFWVEHKEGNSSDLTSHMISIDELEARTGYDFFCNLPDNVELSVEALLNTDDWK